MINDMNVHLQWDAMCKRCFSCLLHCIGSTGICNTTIHQNPSGRLRGASIKGRCPVCRTAGPSVREQREKRDDTFAHLFKDNSWGGEKAFVRWWEKIPRSEIRLLHLWSTFPVAHKQCDCSDDVSHSSLSAPTPLQLHLHYISQTPAVLIMWFCPEYLGGFVMLLWSIEGYTGQLFSTI